MSSQHPDHRTYMLHRTLTHVHPLDRRDHSRSSRLFLCGRSLVLALAALAAFAPAASGKTPCVNLPSALSLPLFGGDKKDNPPAAKPEPQTAPESSAATADADAIAKLKEIREGLGLPDIFLKRDIDGALKGKADAQCAVARRYAEGKGLPKDAVLSEHWYRKAADQDCAEAQYALSGLYERGEVVDKNDKLAFDWCEKAALGGIKEAQETLARYYEEGRGVPKDPQKVKEWIDISKEGFIVRKLRVRANKGDAEAQFELGERYAKGKGVPKNADKAVEWCVKAAEQNFVKAQIWLGDVYSHGDGVKKDEKTGASWYRKAAELGDKDGMCLYGECLEWGRGESVDVDKAAKWYSRSGVKRAKKNLERCRTRRAAESGDAQSQFEMGEICREAKDDGVQQNLAQAFAWYAKAAAQNHAEALRRQGELYRDGKGVATDKAKGADCFLKSAKLGNKDAMCDYGECFHRGWGVKMNDEIATEWLNKSGPTKKAREILDEIAWDGPTKPIWQRFCDRVRRIIYDLTWEIIWSFLTVIFSFLLKLLVGSVVLCLVVLFFSLLPDLCEWAKDGVLSLFRRKPSQPSAAPKDKKADESPAKDDAPKD